MFLRQNSSNVMMCWMDMLVLWGNFFFMILMEGSIGTVVKRALTSYDVITTPGSSFTHLLLSKYSHVGVPSFQPYHTPPHTPPKSTPSLLPHFSGALFGKYTIYSGSLTFSLRPDEAASAWREQNLVLNNFARSLCFSIQELIQHGNKQS